MKKKLSNFWARLAAYLICAACGVDLAASLLVMVLFYAAGGHDDLVDMGFRNIAENYSAYVMTHYASDTEQVDKMLAETNFYCAVVKDETPQDGEIDIYDRKNYVYTNIPEDWDIKKKGYAFTYELEGNPEVGMHYKVKNFMAALSGTYYYGDYKDTYVEIHGVVYDTTEGMFFVDTAAGYFPISYLSVCENGLQYDYILAQKTSGNEYVNNYYGIALNANAYENWDYVRVEGNYYYSNTADGAKGLKFVFDHSGIKENLRTEEWHILDGTRLGFEEQPKVSYKVVGFLPETLMGHDLFWEWKNVVTGVYSMEQNIVIWEMTFAFLFFISLIFLIWTANEKQEKLKRRHKLPLFTYIGCMVLIEIGLGSLFVVGAEILNGSADIQITLEACIMLAMQLAGAMVLVFLTLVSNLAVRIKTKTLIRYSELYYISRPFVKIWKMAREKVSLFWKVTIITLVVDVAELILLCEVTAYYYDEVVVGFILYKIIQLIVILLIVFQMSHLQEGSQRIANGDLSKPIDTEKMVWEFKKHGENINKVGEGISKAVENQLKSERFKTELITNVSHDIKTPLTSIINYVDLIKKENITDPTLCEYVDVLDRQSGRLKKLIEDLMEASKASTGNLKVELEECDISMLIGQVAGEFEDRFSVNGLETIITKPENPIYVMADGRHMWRVLDNLMNNIYKYTLPFSRVYITLEKKENQAVIQFKNISKSQLNISSTELMERFVRGDSSRNTEGSGLGLSIAQSLTELMAGTMQLDIDGDLFKITLTFPALEYPQI